MKPRLRGSPRPKHTNKKWRQNNYYPFGLKHKGYNDLADYSATNKYKYAYGGKELNDELGLDLYDFGARNYDPAIGRWLNVDPLGELTMDLYSYVGNNPIMFTDPTGMAREGLFTKYIDEKGNTLLNTDDGSNAVITVSNKKKDSFITAVKATKDKSLLNSKEWNFTMKNNLVGEWSQWHENTQSFFSTEEARMNIAKFWQTHDYWYAATLSHTGELRSDILAWGLSIAGSLYGTNVAKMGTNNFKRSASKAFKHNYKYAERVRMRAVQDPVSHNFPYGFDDAILATKPIPKNNGYNIFQKTGTMNGKNGVFEIGLTKDGVIDHRFFRPTK